MTAHVLASPEWVDLLVDRFHYLGPAVVLFLCGIGLPVPEEVTLFACGLMWSRGSVAFLPISIVCGAAILTGDSAPYMLGRRYGTRALTHRWVSRILHPDRFAVVERKFKTHGSWVVFVCRFLPGIRVPAYFTAGTMGMSYPRFLLLDALGVAISVPTSIWLAGLFAGQLGRLEERMNGLHLILAGALAAVLGVVVFRVLVRRHIRQAAALKKEQGAGAASD